MRKGVKKHIAPNNRIFDRYPIIPDMAGTVPERRIGRMNQRDDTEVIMRRTRSIRRQMVTGGASSDRYCEPHVAQKVASCGLGCPLAQILPNLCGVRPQYGQ